MSWHNLLEPKSESLREYKLKSKYENIMLKKADSFKDIVGVELKQNEQYRFVTNNSFNAITVLNYVSKNFEIEEIIIAVYRMNLLSVQQLKEFIETNIPVYILLSDFFRENKRYERWCHELISYSQHNSNAHVSFAHNHAKVFLAKTKNMHLVFEGSGNLSDNARIEQYLFENNKQSYDFHKSWILENIINE